MKQLFIILALLLSLTSYAFAQNTTNTDTTEDVTQNVVEKNGAWFAVGIGLSSVDVHLGYHFPNTDMDIRILTNAWFDSGVSIQAELLSFIPSTNNLALYSGIGAAVHSEYGLGLASTTGFDIAIADNSGILIESGVNIFFNNNAEDDDILSNLPVIANRFSIGYRYSF